MFFSGTRIDKRSFNPLRILPVTIMVTSLMMIWRVDDIYKRLTSPDLPIFSVNRSEAQPFSNSLPGERRKGILLPSDDNVQDNANVTDNAASPVASTSGNIGNFTQNEVNMLQKLSERRDALDARQHELDLREDMIRAAERRIDQKIVEIKSMQAGIQNLLKQVDEQDDAKLDSLVRIYERMKPKEVARIFEQLDMPVLISIMSHMKEQKIVPIMEVMKPDMARSITDSLIAKRTAKIDGNVEEKN